MGALLLWWDFWSLLPAAVLLLLGLVLYGRNARDWRHFEKSLELLSEDQPVTPEKGLFSDQEAQLLRIRKEHTEALARAVTSERFRVDLIANVSHDRHSGVQRVAGDPAPDPHRPGAAGPAFPEGRVYAGTGGLPL